MRAGARFKQTTLVHPAPVEAVSGKGYELDPEILFSNNIVGFEQASEDVHPFFLLRSQLLNHVKSTKNRVLAVTSVHPGNGKTHIATNLAAALSRIHPTVLVELDLRRPSISQRLGLPSDHAGIDDFLAGDADLAETGIRIHGTNLTVHAVRTSYANPENLLSSNRMVAMVTELCNAENHPIVIVDTPPAVIQDDIMLISAVVDGVIMVVQEARTTKTALMNAVGSLNPTPVIGTVLNMSISNIQPKNDYGDYYTDEGSSDDEPS